MNKTTRIRFLLGAFGLSALVLTLVSDAGAYRARIHQLEAESRQERADQELILLATINMWQDLVASMEDDIGDCGAALEKSDNTVMDLGDELADLEDDLAVCAAPHYPAMRDAEVREQLYQCRATSPLWKAFAQRESSPAYPMQVPETDGRTAYERIAPSESVEAPS